jgi:hypothetical protein
MNEESQYEEVKDVRFGETELMKRHHRFRGDPDVPLPMSSHEESMELLQAEEEAGAADPAKHKVKNANAALTEKAERLALFYEQAEKLPNHYGISEETVVEVLDTAHWLNNIVRDMTVLSVEPGYSAGWLVVNLGPPPAKCDRLYLTVWCGGPRDFGDCKHDNGCDCEHWWDIALHVDRMDGGRFAGGSAYPVYRSHMPEGNPDKAIVALARRILIGKPTTESAD